MEIFLTRRHENHFEVDLTLTDIEQLTSVRLNETIKVSAVKPRDLTRHKRFFAMLNVGYDAFEVPQDLEFRGVQALKNRNRFRKDCIIQAGFYDVFANINGEVRAEAKSMSFSRMDELEFRQVYNAVANVLLQKILHNYTKDDLDQVVDQLVRF